MNKKEKLKQSWIRCYEKGVNKMIEAPQKRINKKKLEKEKQKNKKTIKIFNKETEILMKKYSFTQMFFLLVNTEKVLLTKKNNLNSTYSGPIKEGDCFTEGSCGTNAISLALKTEDQIFLKSDEHYCYFLHDWSVIAAPIKVKRRIVGCLASAVLKREIREKDRMAFQLLYKNITTKLLKNQFCSSNNKQHNLTEIEKKILVLAANGYKIKEISENLSLSNSSIKYHRKKICDEFEANNIAQAVAKAIKSQFLTTDQIK